MTDITVYWFESLSQLHDWNCDVGQIKFHADCIYKHRQAGETNGDENDYGFWLDLVKRFISRHGKKNVPEDIRSALNSVEEALNRPLTEW